MKLKLLALLVASTIAAVGCGGSQESSPIPKLLAQATVVGGTATFTGPRQNYSVTKNGTSYVVKDNVGADGTQTFANLTTIKFSDISINFTIADMARQISPASLSSIIELYVAFFNRVPDADGLAYWISQAQAGKSILSIADSFYSAGVAYSATTGYSATMTNAAFVNLVYKNVLGRADGADAEGLAYWTGQLASGMQSRGQLVQSILGSAHTFKGDPTYGYVANLLDNKIAVAKNFAIDGGTNYNNASEAITKGIIIAAAVTPADTLAAKAMFNVVGAGANTATDSPEGFWGGSASTGVSVSLAILDDGSTWAVYTVGNSIVGALFGQTNATGNAISGSGFDFNIPTRTVTQGAYSGSFTARSSIKVTTSGGASFTGFYDSKYDQAASLAAIAGNFSGSGVSGNSTVQSSQVVVSANGAISSAVVGCAANGQLAPRSSGKNVFDLKITFTGTNCALGNATVTNGIAYYDATSRQILVVGLNGGRTDGFLYVGVRN